MKKFFKNDLFISICLILLTFIIYFLSYKGEGANWNYFTLLADAFWHGRLNLLDAPPWLNEIVKYKRNFYVVFPPMPAVMLMPFVLLFGVDFPQPYLSIILGAANASLAYLVFRKILSNQKSSIWLSLLTAFGTIQWYHAEVGSAWYFAHICGMFFLWLMILEVFGKQRFFLIGLLIGAAYLSRIPTIMSGIFVLILLQKKFLWFDGSKFKVGFGAIIKLGLGIMPAVLLNGIYNYFRYGVIYDIGYTLLPVFDEPWYQYGFVSIKYIPIHLKEMLLGLPIFSSTPPYIFPNLFAMSILLTTPAFLLIFKTDFKNRLAISTAATVIFIAVPELMHGGNGFTQFGYRHTLDFLPFLLILVALGIGQKINLLAKVLIILSILVNLWGVIMISQLGLGKI